MWMGFEYDVTMHVRSDECVSLDARESSPQLYYALISVT